MTAIRIAHVSDTHLGYRAFYKTDPATGRNQRAIDIERAYETVISDILTRNVDLVIHSGDVFHHTRPAYSTMRAFVRQTRRLEEARVPVVVIAGNHETPRLRTSSSVFSVLELALPEVRFVTGYDLDTVPFAAFNLRVVAVPHGRLADPLPPMVYPERGMINILVTHGLVPGMAVGGRIREPGEEEIGEGLLDPEFDYIALGHFHQADHPRRNAWYAGSTERIGWGDERVEPGYWLVEIAGPGAEPAMTRVPIETRPMRTLPAVNGEGLSARDVADRVLDALARLGQPEAITRVELRNTPRPVRREAEALLRREAHEYVWWLQVYSPADILAPFARRDDVMTADVCTLFDRFVTEREKDYDPAFAEAFRQRGRRALEEALHDADLSSVPEDGAA
ncbi:MAG: hypothetical protein KatS3mg059_1692 [Thermomicrobiales bacterium]|nr:MAG: hypothetical protein KatS3mg059_1692 [Thermomicrobiales bacterium]